MKSWRHLAALIPVVILAAVAATGIASAFQDDEEAKIDLGPQPGDFLDADGEADITGYLIGAAAFRQAPVVPYEEDIDLRVFGCTEGDPVTIDLVSRILNADEEALQEDLEEEEKLLTEPLNLVDEAEALADGSEYTVQIPVTAPPGFVRFRVACAGAEGDLLSDAVGNVVDRETYEAEQAELDEADQVEIVTTLDAGDTPEALAVSSAG